jgi:hypothetical protein
MWYNPLRPHWGQYLNSFLGFFELDSLSVMGFIRLICEQYNVRVLRDNHKIRKEGHKKIKIEKQRKPKALDGG